jgi:hypothetical protein
MIPHKNRISPAANIVARLVVRSSLQKDHPCEMGCDTDDFKPVRQSLRRCDAGAGSVRRDDEARREDEEQDVLRKDGFIPKCTPLGESAAGLYIAGSKFIQQRG